MPKRSSMRKLSAESVARANEALADKELRILRKTSIDWETLRPEVTDKELFEALVVEVQKSTAANESLAEFRARIEKLGKAGVALAKDISKLIR